MTYQPAPRNRANLYAVLGIVALLVVGAVVAIVVTSSGDDRETGAPTPTSTANAAEVRTAAARDAALDDGRAAAVVLNTLDHRSVDDGLDRWESVATGDLLAELARNRDRNASAIRQARSTTSADVLDAALSEFDEDEGTATLIAAVSVDVTIAGEAPQNKRTRLELALERDGDDWKVSALSTV